MPGVEVPEVERFPSGLVERMREPGWWVTYLDVEAPSVPWLAHRHTEVYGSTSDPDAMQAALDALPWWGVTYAVGEQQLHLDGLDDAGSTLHLGDPMRPIGTNGGAHPEPLVFRWPEAVAVARAAAAGDPRWSGIEDLGVLLLLPFDAVTDPGELADVDATIRPKLLGLGLSDPDVDKVVAALLVDARWTGSGWVEHDELGWELVLEVQLGNGIVLRPHSRRHTGGEFPVDGFRALLAAAGTGGNPAGT